MLLVTPGATLLPDSRAPLPQSVLWNRVGELADAASSLSDLRHHKLELIAADRRQARGERLPAGMVEDQRRAALLGLAVPTVLRRVRAACAGPVVLMKGAEAAAQWPKPQLRPAGDVDLFVEDADAVQAALLAAGFVELDDPALYDDLHHGCPLGLPGLALAVEIHRQPHWYGGGIAPSFDEILTAAQPCALGIDGILAPCAEQHAVLLVAHAWAHDPLNRIGPLIDIAAMVDLCGREAAGRVAEDWGVAGPWRATMRAIDEIVGQAPPPRRAPIWKRHLLDVRERTVLESHVTRVVGPVLAASPQRAPVALAGALLGTVRPAQGETWRAKLGRSLQAFRHAAWRRSQHEATIGAAMGEAD